MLVIRKEQLKAFSDSMVKNFEDTMLSILREDFAEACEVLGEAQTRRVIKLGMSRASMHGFEARGDMCDYIALMFRLGSYFDEDPLLPWAAYELEGKEGVSVSSIMNNLYSEAMDYLDRTAGENGENYTSALQRLRELSFEYFTEIDSGDLHQDTRTFLTMLYPERYVETAQESLRSALDLGKASATKHGMGTGAGIILYIGAMFMLGSHFDRDPLYPWACDILRDTTMSTPNTKAQRLHEAFVARID